jgi:hypothetical protein
MFTTQEIERRRRVWDVVSELWLDTELQAGDLKRIAEVCIKSEYSITQLQEIYSCEVAPAVFLNLYTVAGVWAGFDSDWLSESIIKTDRSTLCRWLIRLSPIQSLMTWMTREEWEKILDLISVNRV